MPQHPNVSNLYALVLMIASGWYLSCWLDMTLVVGMAEMLWDILEVEGTEIPTPICCQMSYLSARSSSLYWYQRLIHTWEYPSPLKLPMLDLVNHHLAMLCLLSPHLCTRHLAHCSHHTPLSERLCCCALVASMWPLDSGQTFVELSAVSILICRSPTLSRLLCPISLCQRNLIQDLSPAYLGMLHQSL